MALLKSVDNVPGIDYYDYRDIRYFDQFDYRLRMTIEGVRYAYWCKNEYDLKKKIAGNEKYDNVRKDHILKNYNAILQVIKYTSDRKNKTFRIRLEGNTIAFFANDLSILQEIEKEVGSNFNHDYTQVQTYGYAGTKYLVHPKHSYRVYLNGKRISEDYQTELKDFLDKQKSLYPSPALKIWLKDKGVWTSSMHFIEYDNESTLSYLALMYGNILGRKYKIEKRPITE